VGRKNFFIALAFCRMPGKDKGFALALSGGNPLALLGSGTQCHTPVACALFER